ncbi:Serine/threonine protein kinase [Olavius algarvensis associated proteobacterium Delta 3]|nr:Serine/threonine protein kinase [Olavius algarvensis associated proteobacterium Delta 3]
MPEDRVKRSLRAILSADVAGYSRLMGQDEVATVRTIESLRKVFSDLVEEFAGRVVDTPGDNILAEFSSAVDAVQCAIEIQGRIAEFNETLSPDRRMIFRIGINIGDIIVEGERIYGEGVNIAARIESLAAPGGISISSGVHEQIKQKLALACEDQGIHEVKNISEPIHVFRVHLQPDAMPAPQKPIKHGSRKWIGAAAALLFLALAAGGLYLLKGIPSYPDHAVTGENQESEKPAIAVLPFTNLGTGDQDDYFIDGMTNDIITDLSRFKELMVIASNTMFTFKGKPVRTQALHEDLSVRYILEGSVQKSGDRVRINVQLIDGAGGHHLWAERYDRKLEDVFAVQDDLVQTIVGRMTAQISESERQRVSRKDVKNMQAYDYLLRGLQYYRHWAPEDMRQARQMFQRAIEIDPRYSAVYTAVADTYLWEYLYGTMFPDQTLELVDHFARRALALDDDQPGAHSLVGYVFFRRGDFDAAMGELLRAYELNPNDALTHHRIAAVSLYSGKFKEAARWQESSERLDPWQPAGRVMILGMAYYLDERYQDAVSALKRSIAGDPDYVGSYIVLAAIYSRMGRREDAGRAAKRVLDLDPFFDVAYYGSAFKNGSDRNKIQEDLRKAGLP